MGKVLNIQYIFRTLPCNNHDNIFNFNVLFSQIKCQKKKKNFQLSFLHFSSFSVTKNEVLVDFLKFCLIFRPFQVLWQMS